ncbi:hypothetical protein DUNSADRAFT_3352 [Dunaliella salina]|uniref:Uncharacterized protein n=1 Tax=Dunaliella salina TaxID=3046 RepID=A0ABQ7FVH0_DUNSA|nr:hypothetical protein DUNSADRAFT_3352 [Dunaliella salina]|eukprot:KAF5826382.1 hypothetical protein DUNSADRAFT_3352 [Dunaliella salina]
MTRFCSSPCAAYAEEAFRSLQEFLKHAVALNLIHVSCKEVLQRCRRALRKSLQELRRRYAASNSSGSSDHSSEEPMAVVVIDLTAGGNEQLQEGQGRKRARQDLDSQDEEEDADAEEAPSRSSNPQSNGFGTQEAELEEDVAQGHVSTDKESCGHGALAHEVQGHGVHAYEERGHGAPQSQQQAVLRSQHSIQRHLQLLQPATRTTSNACVQRQQQCLHAQPSPAKPAACQHSVYRHQQMQACVTQQPQRQGCACPLQPEIPVGSPRSQEAPCSQQGVQSQSSRRKQLRPSRHTDLPAVAGSAAGTPEEDEERALHLAIHASGLGKSVGVATPFCASLPHQGSPAASKRVHLLHCSTANLPVMAQPPLW